MKAYHQPKKKKRAALLPLCMIIGIILLSAVLFLLFRPFTPEDVLHQACSAWTFLSQKAEAFAESAASRTDTSDSRTSEETAVQDTEETIPYMKSTGESGDIASLQAEYINPPDQVYLYMLDTQLGPMLYYHQADIRWADFLYGGYDPMSTYGCGPTAAAMVISSFSDTSVDPTDIAVWASENGYYALHGGSYHSLIPDAMEAYGLHVESVTDRSCEHVSELLSSGHILVALMGKGALTNNGHFVLFTQLLEDGKISIADPVNYENCMLEWDLEQLLSELKKSYDSGGPLWAVSVP